MSIEYWHKATRLDTNLGKKRRHREVNPTTGEVFYREHWRHVQYDTDEQIASDFFKSVDYAQYVAEGGPRFSKDLFLQCKCFCVVKSDFQECACPPCTLMRETLRGWHAQRQKWFRKQDEDGSVACSCGVCEKGSAYRMASGSLAKLRSFVHEPCGKVAFPSLAIDAGPKKTEQAVEFYRRQCCRAPILRSACPDACLMGDCSNCSNCSRCGWVATIPMCPVEHNDTADAEWKEYRPRLDLDGRSFQDELVTKTGTRRQLMERLEKLFAEWSPHDWIDRWTTHMRHMTYATFSHGEMCISTDFSAQYDHKAFCTRTCEHPRRSNMDVFVVTHSPRIENGKRKVTTDIWRIFSEAKGSSLFHNTALNHITVHYRERLQLQRIFLFSDGCRAQYKGKRNFLCIAQFPSQLHCIQLVHRFAASHHFKGPHDAYGKDAKQLCRTAERNQKARLASTHDVYFFCATMLPCPRRGLTAKDLVAPLPLQPPTPRTAEQLSREQRAAAKALADAPTQEAAAEMAVRLQTDAGVAVLPLESAEPMDPAASASDAAATVEWEATQEATREEAAAEEATDMQDAAVFAQEAESHEELGTGDFEFEFDETGARLGADHSETSEAEALDVALPELPVVEQPTEPPAKRQRTSRKVVVISQQSGTEAGTSGARHINEWGRNEPGMFSASNYFWLYYSANPGLKEVPVGQLAQPGECHATLDEAADIDADSIPGSNSTYEFVGTSVDHPELLYIRTYPCACRKCVEPAAVSTEYSNCPNMGMVGCFVQHTIRGATNVVKQRTVQRMKVADLASGIKAECLYAAFASFRERGDRSYWLLVTKSAAKQAKGAIKVVGGNTIRSGQWVVEAQWYSSTSDAQGRKSYKLLPERVHVPIGSLVPEHGLKWQHEGRSRGESILSEESHLVLMSHNYSNVQ